MRQKNDRSMVVRGLAALLGAAAVWSMGGCFAAPEESDELALEEGQAAEAEQELTSCNSCPGNMTAYRGQNGYTLHCYCPNGSSGSVWGTGLYTDDSSLCRAALHAGAIPATGGFIEATVQPGASSYTGSTSNGVTSNSYGSWYGSYTVASAGSCILPCPSNLTGYRGQNGTVVTCDCTSAATSSGSVWGTGVYTDDSILCRAALHAGVIGTSGGTISAVIQPGQSKYDGTLSNGVTSYSYGSWYGSYSF
jgi:hypothetical protein